MVDLHIGELIEERLKEVGMTKSEFARRINRARQNINDILQRKSIDTDLLYDISIALSYNFFEIYCKTLLEEKNLKPETIKEPASCYENTSQSKQVERYQEELKNAQQEIKYLKKINRLLEKRLEGE
jgi:transcriptional regulator with XRE-family HTH domain